MKILIVYGSTEGQTKKIAQFIEADANKAGHVVDLCDATNNMLSPIGYDMVFVGASMHMEKYQESIKHYLQHYAKELRKLHTAFFSVSLTAASDDSESWKELKDTTEKFLKVVDYTPYRIEYLAGALRFTQYDFMKKFIMRQIAAKAGRKVNGDTEYTDWDKVSSFVTNVIEGFKTRPISVGAELTDNDIIG